MSVRRTIADWLDDRLGTRAIGEALFARKIPRGTGWIYTLGSVTLFLFLLQAATGMFLATSYSPSPDHAYDSVRYISEEAPFGWLVRGLHVWGASAMVLAVVLHMLRTFVTGAYKYPRETSWVTGVVLLLLVLGFGFTGYLLPWNQTAYWATSVGVSIAAQAPILGPAIAALLRGGEDLGAQTLARFYAFHVLFLPAAILAIVSAHLFMVVRQGISAPPVREKEPPTLDLATERQREKARYLAEKEAGHSFYPYSLAKDAVAVLIVFAVVGLLAWLKPPETGDIADPTDTTFNPRPEWYFLFLFQFLKYFPGSLESIAAVVLPSVVIVALLLLPFVDRRMLRHPLDRPVAMTVACGAVVAIVSLTIAGYRSPTLSAYVPRPRLVSEGERLFREFHCIHCHSVRGRGGPMGPDLALAVFTHDAQWTTAHLKNPAALIAGSKAGGSELLDEEVVAVDAYVEELRGGGPPSEAAARLFRRQCMECHRLGNRGNTEKGPDLTAIGSARQRWFLHRYIEDPKSILATSKMPAFLAPEGPLTHAQVEDLARYLAAQQGAPTPATEPARAPTRSDERKEGGGA